MSFILPVFSVCLAFILAYFVKVKSTHTHLLLAFSGGFLLSVTILEFLPEVYSYEVPLKWIGCFVLAGIILQMVLEYLSGGAEHGHIHIDENKSSFPIALFISLCIHAFFEGFPVLDRFHLLLGIVVHKLPIAFVLSIFLLKSKLKLHVVIIFMLIFALMTPLGSLLKLQLQYSNTLFIPYLEALVVGLLLHIASTILFESSKQHKFNIRKFLSIITGISLALFISFIE